MTARRSAQRTAAPTREESTDFDFTVGETVAFCERAPKRVTVGCAEHATTLTALGVEHSIIAMPVRLSEGDGLTVVDAIEPLANGVYS